MASADELIAEISGLAGGPSPADGPPLSTRENLLGYSRSVLAGPTLNFEDNIEAMIASLFGNKTYDNKLDEIRTEQNRFKAKTDYLDNAVELGTGAVLNPLSAVGKLKTIGVPAVTTIASLLSSAPSQAAIASAGAADGKDVLENAVAGGVVGAGFSAGASVLGSVLEKGMRQVDRLKLSAFGIGAADIAKQFKSLGDEAPAIADAGNLPILQTLKKAEKAGIVDVGNDIIGNAKNVRDAQKIIAGELRGVLVQADAVLPPKVDFDPKATIKYIESLSGTARNKANEAASAELSALLDQMKTGTLAELQQAKIGLNYKFDQNPYADDVIKALRSDLRAEIEKRVDDAANAKILPAKLAGEVKTLNSTWGNLAELKDAFVRRASKDLQGDVVEDVFKAGATTGGVGSLNQASAATGNPIFTAVGSLLSAARYPESKNALADILADPAVGVPLQKFGEVLPEVVTGRNVAQAREALTSDRPSDAQPSSDQLQSLISEIRTLGVGDQGANTTRQPPQGRSELPTETTPAGREYDPTSPYSLFSPTSLSESSAISDLFGDKNMPTKEAPATLIKAVISQESAGNAYATSDKGAKGLMQLMPATAKEIAKDLGVKDYDLTDRETNIRFGTYYLNKLLDQFGGDAELALTAYHSGPGRVAKLLKLTGGDSLADIIDYLGPVGKKYAKEVLGRIKEPKVTEV